MTTAEAELRFPGRLPSRVWKAWQKPFSDGPLPRVTAVVAILFVAFGFALRARGYLFNHGSMWLDECSWAINLIRQPLVDLLIRPIGFMAVSKALVRLFSPSETVLRALPWVGGMATLLFSPFLASRLFKGSAARLFFIAVIALQPCIIDFSKEFKPYSLSVTGHVIVTFLALRYRDSRRMRDLMVALVVTALSHLFAQDLIFAYPAVFLVLAWTAFRHERRHLTPIFACAFVIIVALALQYALIWSRLGASEGDFWGNKYNVFYTGRDESYLSWLSERYADMARFPGIRRRTWKAAWLSRQSLAHLKGWDGWLWLALHFAGLGALAFKKRYQEALLLITPTLMSVFFNFAGLWPAGAFRTNLFTIFYMTAIASMAFEWIKPERWRAAAAAPAFAVVLLPLLLFEHKWHEGKRFLCYEGTGAELVEYLATDRRAANAKKELLIIDRKSCDPWVYYSTIHPRSKRFGPELARRFELVCLDEETQGNAPLKAALQAAAESAAPRVWTIHEDSKDPVYKTPKEFRVAHRERFSRQLVLELARQEPEKAESEKAEPEKGKHKKSKSKSKSKSKKPEPEPEAEEGAAEDGESWKNEE